eukprot:7941450-Alexandrium_andersonii.AAC.1
MEYANAAMGAEKGGPALEKHEQVKARSHHLHRAAGRPSNGNLARVLRDKACSKRAIRGSPAVDSGA